MIRSDNFIRSKRKKTILLSQYRKDKYFTLFANHNHVRNRSCDKIAAVRPGLRNCL